MTNPVLVSGGTGYVGSKIVASLSNAGYEVVVLTRRLPLSSQADVRYVVHDMTWSSIIAGLEESRADTVIHTAAKYLRQHQAVDVAPMIEANFSLGVLLLDAAAIVGVPRLLYTGSFFQHSGSPPGTPRNLYAALKNAFEEILSYYASTRSIDAVSLTLGDVYGEDDPRPRVLNTAVASALSGAVIQVPKHDPYLVPVHVDDVTAAVATAMSQPFANQTYWVGPDAAVRLSEILATIAILTGATLRTEQADFPSLPGDTLAPPPGDTPPGWSPSVTLEEGIRQIIRAYRANGDDRR